MNPLESEMLVPSPRHILFLSTGMTAGGAERVIATLANELARRGYRVTIAMLKGESSAYPLADNVRLLSAKLQPGIRNLGRAFAFYRRTIKEARPDVVASLSTKTDLLAVAFRFWSRSRHRLVVSDRADPNTRAARMQLACNLLYRWSDAIVCQSEAVADYYRQMLPRTPIAIIPNPLDPDAVGQVPLERTKSIICVGRLASQKNHALAIEAFRILHAEDPELRLHVFGEGPLESELENLIATYHLTDSAVLEGVTPQVICAKSDAAMLLFTSRHEGYPNVLVEAAASALPIVTTDFSPGTAREIVHDGVNGFIVEPSDLDGLVSAARKVFEGALDPQTLAMTAARVRERHDRTRIADAWLSVLSGSGNKSSVDEAQQ